MCTFQLCFPQYGGPSLVFPSAENTVLQLCKEYLDALMVQYWYEFKTSPGCPRPRDLCFLGWGGGLFSVILLWKFKKFQFYWGKGLGFWTPLLDPRLHCIHAIWASGGHSLTRFFMGYFRSPLTIGLRSSSCVVR